MILRLLVSIPQVFRPENLYDFDSTPGNAFYALRGMILFTGNHYYAYILQKDQHQGANVQQWVQFNDNFVTIATGGWSEILSECLNGQAYPTVLVYELKDSTQESDIVPDSEIT